MNILNEQMVTVASMACPTCGDMWAVQMRASDPSPSLDDLAVSFSAMFRAHTCALGDAALSAEGAQS